MQILIKETVEKLRRDYGYEDCDDDDDALLFQQGFDGYVIDVDDGDYFKIPDGSEGQILDDEPYYMKVQVMEGFFDDVEIENDLRPGSYVLSGNVVSRR